MPTRIESNISRSAELTDVEDVHVVIVLVLARHDPDERVGAGSHPHVDRPGRRNHRLAVRHDDFDQGGEITASPSVMTMWRVGLPVPLEFMPPPCPASQRWKEKHTLPRGSWPGAAIGFHRAEQRVVGKGG